MNDLSRIPGWRTAMQNATRPMQAQTPSQRQAPAPRDELRNVRLGYMLLVVAAAAVQVVVFARAEFNLASTLMALASSLIGIAYALDSRRFRAQPVSALILLMYTTTSTAGALMVKSLEWAPLADRLHVPLTTFAVLLGGQVSLLLADRLYARSPFLAATRRFVSNRLLLPIGIFKWPTDQQFWMLGFIGCISVLLTGTDYESGASFGMASAGAKLFRAFGFLKFAPFLIPFRHALSGVPSRQNVPVLSLAAFFALLVVISFATNSRSTFADAIPTVAICVLIAASLGRIDFQRIPKYKLVLFALAAVLGSVLLSRIALAMVVVRDYRYNADIGMLVRLTLEALFNSEWLEGAKAKMETSINIADYSETYVDSRFFGRFLLTKFHDNIIYYFSLMGPDQIAAYKAFMMDRLVGTLPDPLLRLFGIALNKQDLVISNGDYVIYLVDGWGLGGFKTGSLIADTYAIGGWFSPLLMVGCALLLFVFHDAFVVRSAAGLLAFSPLIVLLIWNLCGTTAAFGLGAETLTAVPAGILRGLPQNVLVYAIAMALVRGISRMLPWG